MHKLVNDCEIMYETQISTEYKFWIPRIKILYSIVYFSLLTNTHIIYQYQNFSLGSPHSQNLHDDFYIWDILDRPWRLQMSSGVFQYHENVIICRLVAGEMASGFHWRMYSRSACSICSMYECTDLKYVTCLYTKELTKIMYRTRELMNSFRVLFYEYLFINMNINNMFFLIINIFSIFEWNDLKYVICAYIKKLIKIKYSKPVFINFFIILVHGSLFINKNINIMFSLAINIFSMLEWTDLKMSNEYILRN